MYIKQLNSFNNAIFPLCQTQGIKYTGSKLKLLPYIIQIVSELDGVYNVLDGFSGSTRVSQAFAQLGYQTTANDIALWSQVFATCYLKSNKSDVFYQDILDHLNNLSGYDGWYTKYYGARSTEVKRPFQAKNTQKLDAIRDEIDKLNLSWNDKCVVLTSLIYALDAVDSTLGHYVSYLSAWSPRSYNNLLLKLPQRFKHDGGHNVVCGDVFNLNNKFDFAYLDPPYGSNNEKMPPSRVRYAAYYHIWTTIIKHDKPEVFGRANRRVDSRDAVAPSVFEEFRKDEEGKFIATNALRKLIMNINSRFILLSYSSGGRSTKQEIFNIIKETGELLKIIKIDYKKNVMANMKWSNHWANSDRNNYEYLFLIQKQN